MKTKKNEEEEEEEEAEEVDEELSGSMNKYWIYFVAVVSVKFA